MSFFDWLFGHETEPSADLTYYQTGGNSCEQLPQDWELINIGGPADRTPPIYKQYPTIAYMNERFGVDHTSLLSVYVDALAKVQEMFVTSQYKDWPDWYVTQQQLAEQAYYDYLSSQE